jgi:hypothetical protein
MGDARQLSASAISQSRDPIGPGASPEALSGPNDARVDNLASIVASFGQVDPDFIAELDTLSITIDEYERMLADNEPLIITTDNTVGSTSQ